MVNTNNMHYLVSKALEEDSILRIGFERGLISPGNLAKQIVKIFPDQGLNPESVRTSIRRFKKNIKKQNILNKAEKVLGGSYLHVRSNIVKIEFKKDESTLQLLNKSFRINEIYNNDIFRLIKGHSVFHAIVEEVNVDKLLDLFEGKIIKTQEGLCEFIIIMPQISRITPGIYMTLINELSMNNINIVQAFSCGEEINLIVDEKDNQKTYNLLTSLFKRCRMNSAS